MSKIMKYHPFMEEKGASLLAKPIPFFLMIISLLGMGYLASGGVVNGMGIIAMPLVLTYIYFICLNPKIALIGMFILNYFILGFARYVKGIPYGMVIDFHLFLALLVLFFQSFFKDVHWEKAKNPLFALAIIWFGWIVFQLFNPMATARPLWFQSMRGIGLYMFLIIPLVFILFDKIKDLERFFKIWAVLAIFASIKGIVQKHIGLDPWEQAWLNGPGSDTHLLFGKLRVFSFFTDAGQFGGSQGHAGVIFSILALNEKKSKKTRLLYAIAGGLALFGMMISGTRGAIAVPIMGFGLYTILQKNVKVMIAGAILGISVLVFFKYTTIGNGNYTINRMRTAFNPEDKSLQVRLENQRKLKKYMASRPIGTGLGSTTGAAKRYAPGSLAAQVPTDSWYVMIWVEQGIVGLFLHLFILLFIVLKSSYVIFFRLKDPWVKAQMSALVAGIWGIMVASYGNAVLGQLPTGPIVYASMAFLFMAEKFDKEEEKSPESQQL